MREHVELYKTHLVEQKERAFAKWQASRYTDLCAWNEFLRLMARGIEINADMRMRGMS